MEIDIFPVVLPETPIASALQSMQWANRSALVVRGVGAQYSLVEAPEIVFAKAEGTAQTLAPLTSRTPLSLVPPNLIVPGAPLDFGMLPTELALEQFMDGANVRFVILAITPTRAVVASRNETDMPDQASPRDCYCKTDRKPVVPGVPNGNCPHNGSHLGTVRCV